MQPQHGLQIRHFPIQVRNKYLSTLFYTYRNMSIQVQGHVVIKLGQEQTRQQVARPARLSTQIGTPPQ